MYFFQFLGSGRARIFVVALWVSAFNLVGDVTAQPIALRVDTPFGTKPYNTIGVAVDAAGTFYFADYWTSKLQTYTIAGGAQDFAGSGYLGFSDGAGASAMFNGPSRVLQEASGNFICLDEENFAIRRITPAGIVSTVAGRGVYGVADGDVGTATFGYNTGLAIAPDGSIYVASSDGVRKISSGIVSTVYSSVGAPGDITPIDVGVDGSGAVYVVASNSARICRLNNGNLVDVAILPGGSSNGTSSMLVETLEVARDGTFYVGDLNGGNVPEIWKIAPGQPAVLLGLGAVGFDPAGNVYLVGPAGIKKFGIDGTTTLLADALATAACVDGRGLAVRFSAPVGLALDPDNNLFVADSGNHRIRKISAAGDVTTFAGSTQGYQNNATGTAAQFNNPNGIARASSGYFYVTDTGNHVVRSISPTGEVLLFAGIPGMPGFQSGIRIQAQMNGPTGIAFSPSGDLYIADTGNGALRFVSVIVSNRLGLVADSGFAETTALCFDPTGNLYFPGYDQIFAMDSNRNFRVVAGDGFDYGLLDGRGTAAQFNFPSGMAMDSRGLLYVADTYNNAIRMIGPSGLVHTVAGSGDPTFSDGRGYEAGFHSPTAIAIDAQDNFYISDTANHTIRHARLDFADGLVLLDYPGDTVAPPGGAATFKIIAGGGSNPVFSWQRRAAGTSTWQTLSDTGAYSGSASSSLTVSGITNEMDQDLFRCVISDGNTNLSTPALKLIVAIAPSGATLEAATGTMVVAGQDLSFTVGNVSGTPPFTYTLMRGNVTFLVSSDPQLTLSSVTDLTSGVYYVVVSNVAGTFSTNSVAVNVTPVSPPVITQQPSSTTATVGSFVSLSVSGNFSSNEHYEWMHGVTPVGNDQNTLAFQNVTMADAGTYTVTVTNAAGFVTSNPATLTVIPDPNQPPADPNARLINISTRSFVGTGPAVQIAGFVISGTTAKTVLIRAGGPALIPFGVSGVLADPQIELHDANNIIGTNDDWSSDPNLAAAVETARQTCGASAWPSGSKDAAIVQTLQPGNYTAIVSGVGGTTGVALIEVYEVGQGASRLVNISTRSEVKTQSAVQIAGFIISGTLPKRVLIRAGGPSLVAYGVTDSLVNPQLELHDSQSIIGTNDDWGTNAAEVELARQQCGAAAWDYGSKDAAIVQTLQPGSYTAIVSGVGDTTGVALIEVFELP